MDPNSSAPEMPQPCDEWHELVVAAGAAGRWAARQFARRYSAAHLALLGHIDVHIGPLASPVAHWLQSTGQAVVAENQSGVFVPIVLTAADLRPTEDAWRKSRSLLVAHAYAVAYTTVLGDDAGVATDIRIRADSIPASRFADRTRTRVVPMPLELS